MELVNLPDGEKLVALGLHQPIPEPNVQPATAKGTDPAHQPDLKIVPLQQFATTHEDTAEPLLGTKDDTILPAGGMLLMYGDGGAGKTTLTIDAIAHLASGTGWIGHHTARTLTTLLIENEGPRGKLRQILHEKIQAWTGRAFAPHVHVLEEPWTRFTLADPTHRQQLGALITEHLIDLLILGPLATIGTTGGGTPDEINAFDNLLTDLRTQTPRAFALWILHHENKAGDVSGAWERVPDTLLHVQGQGNGRTRLHWRKARWASTTHGTSVNLLWDEGRTFKVEEKPERDLPREIIEALADGQWRTGADIGRAVKSRLATIRPMLNLLVSDGRLEHAQPCPGRSPKSLGWRLKLLIPDAGNSGISRLIDPGQDDYSHASHLYKGDAGVGIVGAPGDDSSRSHERDEANDPEAQRLIDLYVHQDHDAPEQPE